MYRLQCREPHFRECYVQVSGPEDASLLERCPHFRGCYVQASLELERCPHFRGCMYRLQDLVSSF